MELNFDIREGKLNVSDSGVFLLKKKRPQNLADIIMKIRYYWYASRSLWIIMTTLIAAYFRFMEENYSDAFLVAIVIIAFSYITYLEQFKMRNKNIPLKNISRVDIRLGSPYGIRPHFILHFKSDDKYFEEKFSLVNNRENRKKLGQLSDLFREKGITVSKKA